MSALTLSTTLSSEILFAFASFALVSSITPGPNNIFLLSSGVHFGFRRSIAPMLGITLGFSLMVFLVGLGLSNLFETLPFLYTALCYISAGYFLYLAWQILRSGLVADGSPPRKPWRFLQAAAFQWVNPKAWIMAIAAVTIYVPQDSFIVNTLIIALLFTLFVAPSGCLWILCGTWISRFLNNPLRLRLVNAVMAGLLVFSIYPIFQGMA